MASKSSETEFNTLQIGLTGSIGMGKSTITSQLERLGFPVFDADRAVHHLYAKGGKAIEPMKAQFPDAIVNDAVDRTVLMKKVMENPAIVKSIEAIVHPLVAAERYNFYEEAKRNGKFMVVYDIPLLFENMSKYSVDHIIVVSAGEETQKKRVLERPGMTEEKFKTILAKQVPDSEKRARADFVIETDFEGFVEGRAQLAATIESIIDRNAAKWEQWTKLSKPLRVNSVENTVSGGTSESDLIRQSLDAVVFDLDDTLAPILPIMEATFRAIMTYLAVHMPKTTEELKKNYKMHMGTIHRKYPLITHDPTETRRRVMRETAELFHEDPDGIHVEAAMKIALRTRSSVDPYLYDDTVECLEWLRGLNIPVAVLTNGNARLNSQNCEILSKYLSFSLIAEEVGAAKPAKIGFLACTQKLKTVPSRILYIGDSHGHDVVGAKSCGMLGGLLHRQASTSPSFINSAHTPDLLLNSLRVSELKPKLVQLFSTSN